MTAENALPIAVEARELGRAAHKRLDGINGSIGKLNDKVDRVDEKIDTVLLRLAEQDGRAQASSGLLNSRRFLITTLVIVLTSSLASPLFNVVLRRHG